MKDEYSPYKIVHHLDKINELKANMQCVPLQIHLIPTNLCNQNCNFCAYRLESNPSNECFDTQEEMPYSKLMESLQCFSDMGVKAIQFTGGGEPLVYPNIYNAFTQTIDKGMEMSLVTNGMALDHRLIKLLSSVAWVRVSLDAGTANTYSNVRNTDKNNFYKVINSISKLATMKTTTILGVGFVVNKDNYHEIYRTAVLCKSLGVDNFRISAAFTPQGYNYFDSFIDEAREQSLMASSLTDKYFTVFNLFNDRIKDTFVGEQKYSVCNVKELITYVAADCNVYTCCTLAYNHNGLIGSIKNQSFSDLWLSKDKQEFFRQHDPRILCKTPCLYKEKNDFINYCVKAEPKHINFI